MNLHEGMSIFIRYPANKFRLSSNLYNEAKLRSNIKGINLHNDAYIKYSISSNHSYLVFKDIISGPEE